MFTLKLVKKVEANINNLIRNCSVVKTIKTVGSVSRKHQYVKDLDLVLLLQNPKGSTLSHKELFKKLKNRILSDDNINIKKSGLSYISLVYTLEGVKKPIPVDIWIAYIEDTFDFLTFHYQAGKAIMTYKYCANLFGLTLNRYGLFLLTNKDKTDKKDLTPYKVSDLLSLCRILKQNKQFKMILKNIFQKRKNNFSEIVYTEDRKRIDCLLIKGVSDRKISEIKNNSNDYEISDIKKKNYTITFYRYKNPSNNKQKNKYFVLEIKVYI